MSVAIRRTLDEWEAGELAVEYDPAEPQEVIAWALENFGDRIAVCTSFQAEGMAILDMAVKINPRVRVFTVDTQLLPRASYDLMAEVEQKYGIIVERYRPGPAEVRAMVARHGQELYYRAVPLRLLCCDVRKVRPLRRVLSDLDGWITGLRREQWASRSNIRKIELDQDHGGIVKVNPLAEWAKEEVWEYIKDNDVPVHALYALGYASIGCDPCTRPIEPGEDSRAGRWWWEQDAPKECGIHCRAGVVA
jgi:thioredoxin-dependent adenylylsulfate APS reductase